MDKIVFPQVELQHNLRMHKLDEVKARADMEFVTGTTGMLV